MLKALALLSLTPASCTNVLLTRLMLNLNVNKTWSVSLSLSFSLSLRGKHRLRGLRRIFGCERDISKGEMEKTHK
jgi:hypothetical protein